MKSMCFLTDLVEISPMQTPLPLLASASGFKRFFSLRPAVETAGIAIRGLGIREMMPAGIIDRPEGTGDYLFMLFHDAAIIGAAGDQAIRIMPDTMMIWPPGMAQRYGHPRERFRHSWLHVAGRRIDAVMREIDLPLGGPFPAPDVALMLQCLSMLHHELACQQHPDFRIAGNLLENGLRETARLRRGDAVGIDAPLLDVRRKIDAGNYQMTLQELAAAAGMPVTTFSARFKKAFGFSPKAYVIQHRLRHAAHLLRNTNLTVAEVAAQVGYNDPFHFSKLFKTHLNMSPVAWRTHGESFSKRRTRRSGQ